MIETERHLRDPITFEVFRNAVSSLADEMAISVLRTAHSQIIAESIDFSTALCDASGRVIAQGNTCPVHLGAFPAAMEMLLSRYGTSINQGDVFVTNDPDEGGMHLPDLFVMKPVHVGNDLVGFAVCMAHHADIGGRVPGGGAVDSTEIFQEGLQIPLLKLEDRGVANETLIRILERNVRVPALVLGDLSAQLNACRTGEVGLVAQVQRHGVAGFQALVAELLEYSDRLLTTRLLELGDTSCAFEDCLDDDGFGPGRIPIAVRITVSHGRMHVDFTGSAPQVPSALNCTPSFTKSATYAAIQAALGGDIPSNAGFYRPISFTIPPVSILDGRRPAARAARGLLGYRIVDAVWGALAQLLPDTIPAAGEGGPNSLTLAVVDDDGRSNLFVDPLFGAWGARPDRDGLDGASPLAGNLANTPVEDLERTGLVEVQRYGFVEDSGGAGRWRGGLSIVREHRLLRGPAVLQIRSDRRIHPPYGLEGGLPGGACWNVLDPGPKQRVLPSKVTRTIERGQVIRHVTAGGGGHGDPLDREPDMVRQDVLDGKVSAKAARHLYGVVVTAAGELNEKATRRRRASLRARQSTIGGGRT